MFEIGKTYRDEKIPKKTKWFYSVSGLGRDAAYCIVASFLVIFLQEAHILSTDVGQYTAMMGVLTGLMIGYRIFDALNDPFMGVIIEKTHFKLGKYKPWIFIGSLTNIVCILALFCAPTAFSWCRGWTYVGWFAVFYLLWGMTFTINDISFWGMLPSMSKDEKERAKVTSLMLIFCYVGSFVVAAGMPYLTKAIGNKAYWIMAIVIGTIFVISQTFVFLFCKEHVREDDNKETVKFSDMIKVLKDNDQIRLMIVALFCYFFSTSIFNALMQNVFYISIGGYGAGKTMMTVFNSVNNIAMIVPLFFMPHLLKKHAKMSLFKLTYGIMIIGLIIFFFYGMPIGNTFISPVPSIINSDGVRVLNASYAVIYSIITAVIFIAQGAAYTIVIIMMTDCIEYNQYKTGSRKEAVIFALRPLTTKLAGSIQQGVTMGSLLMTGVMPIMAKISDITGQEGLSDIERAKLLDAAVQGVNIGQVWGLKACCVLIPTLLASICWFLLAKYYKIDEQYYKNICKEIKKREAK